MSYQACIFDLDGTLCDSVESIAWSGNQMLRDLGLRQASLEDYKIFVGDGVDVLMRRLLRFGGDEEGVRFDEAKRRYMEYFQEGCLYNVKAYPGIVEMLAALKKQGAKLSVLSNKPHGNTRNVIEKVFGPEMFDLVQGQSELFPRKPAPDGALYLADKLGAAPKDCLYVGDTGTDMKTGKAAGMYTVGVLWGFRDEEELIRDGADCVAADAMELVDIYGRENRENDKACSQ